MFSFLDLPNPKPGESVDQYRQRLEKDGPDGSELDNCGDTLFAFILRELSDAEFIEEALDMMQDARNDIIAIREGLKTYRLDRLEEEDVEATSKCRDREDED